MKKLETMFASLLGGSLVYIACAASPEGTKQESKVDAAFVETGSETRVDSFASEVIALMDAVVPDVSLGDVRDASADDAGTGVTLTGKCDKSWSVNGSVGGYYAQFSFPGKTREQLARRVTVTTCTTYATTYFPPGGECGTGFASNVIDGAVLVNCGNNPSIVTSLTARYE